MTPRAAQVAVDAGVVSRRAYIDWLRGIAVLLMVLWHVVDAWHVADDRGTAAFHVIGSLAGWAAPMFLFLAGVSLPLAGQARMTRDGLDRRSASRLLVRRGWFVFLLAHLFRLQSFVLNPTASWAGLFRPDILNILGLGMVMAGFAWGRAASPRARVGWLLLPAVIVVAVLTPWIPAWGWPSLLPSRLEGYIRIVNGNAVFSLFPAVAYVFAGAFAGAALAERPGPAEASFHTRAVAAGLGLMAAAFGATLVTWGETAHWWTRTLWLMSWRVGVLVLMLPAAWWLLRDRRPSAAHPLMVFGRASLFVYWVHVELAYGRLSYPLHKALPLAWALVAWAVVLAALYGAARLWLRRPAGRYLIPSHMRAQ